MSENLNNQEKLDEMYHLMTEMHETLRGMRKREQVANAFRFLYWLVILGALGGVYYYISPLISSVESNREKIENSLQQFDQLRAQFPQLDNAAQLLKKEFVPASTSTK
jgi:hypothetical protein